MTLAIIFIISVLIIVFVFANVIAAIMGFSLFIFLLPRDRKRMSAKRMISEGKLYSISSAKQLRRELSKDKSQIEDLELANQLAVLIEKQEGKVKARS